MGRVEYHSCVTWGIRVEGSQFSGFGNVKEINCYPFFTFLSKVSDISLDKHSYCNAGWNSRLSASSLIGT